MYAVAAPLFVLPLLRLLFFILVDYAHNASVCHTLFRNIYVLYYDQSYIHMYVCVYVCACYA